jgi:hypothetical protein
MPPIYIGSALCTALASAYGMSVAVAHRLPANSLEVLGAGLGLVTGCCGICYGVYSMCAVWRTVQKGTDGTSNQRLGAVEEYIQGWYSSNHKDVPADMQARSLIDNDFLEHVQAVDARLARRAEVDRAIASLEVDVQDVEWPEDEPFATGGFSQVFRVSFRGTIVAAKVLARAQAQSLADAEGWLHGVKREAAIMHRLAECKNIVTVLGLFEKADGAVVLMEYASGGTLGDYLRGVPADPSTGTTTGTSGGTTSRRSAKSTVGSTGTSVGSTGTSVGSAGGDGTVRSSLLRPLSPLSQVEQLSILIDIARGLAFCYAQVRGMVAESALPVPCFLFPTRLRLPGPPRPAQGLKGSERHPRGERAVDAGRLRHLETGRCSGEHFHPRRDGYTGMVVAGAA